MWLNDPTTYYPGTSLMAQGRIHQLVKNTPTMQEIQDLGLIPGSGRSPGEGNGNPLQYFCLGNPMDRGAWWATAHGIKEADKTWRLNHHHHQHILSRLPKNPLLYNTQYTDQTVCNHLFKEGFNFKCFRVTKVKFKDCYF